MELRCQLHNSPIAYNCIPRLTIALSAPTKQNSPMPIVSIFFGIVIRMFHREHAPPHYHASYQGFEAL
jgi:Domain of unknown function (DUF4160)